MTPHARLLKNPACGAESVMSVGDALKAAGVRLEENGCPEKETAALLLFGEVDEVVVALARDASGGGTTRVLAIHLGNEDDLDADGHWRLLKAGATDILQWRADACCAQTISERLQRWREIDDILNSNVVRKNLIGACPRWRAVLRQVIETARFSDAAVLITGESGTGKELVARLIHTLDPRENKAELVILDCTTIVPELSGSELFGHERGAFTGASNARDGAFALAANGTLFLDEVGELPPAMQAQLLRVVQEHAYKRVGANQWQRSNFRLICATNRDLQAEVGSGTFRSDLYYRIASCTCELPPLRERLQDIVPLSRHFLANGGGAAADLTPVVRDFLLQRRWPGNVRELRQLMARIAARHVGAGPVTPGDLPPEEWPHATSGSEDAWSDEFERVIQQAVCRGVKLKELSQYAAETAIRLVVGEESGNLQRAARRLGVTDRALQLRRANGHPLRVAN
jgi:transcriptional regulator with GAF, ATPase, and Fis domain